MMLLAKFSFQRTTKNKQLFEQGATFNQVAKSVIVILLIHKLYFLSRVGGQMPLAA